MKPAAGTWHCSLIAVALSVGASVPARAQVCLHPTSGAVGMCYLQWQPGCAFADNFIEVITESMRSYDTTPEVYRQSFLPADLIPRGNQYTLEWAASVISAKGLILLDTHGYGQEHLVADGSVGCEWTPNHADALERYDEYIKDGTFLTSEIDVETGTGKVLMFLPTGIQRKLVPDSAALVYGSYCYSWFSNDRWACAAFIGTTLRAVPCVANKEAAKTIFANLKCVPNNPSNHTIDSAIPPHFRTAPDLLLEWRGGGLAIDCSGCAGMAARFDRHGAFKDTAWGVVEDDGTSRLSIVGYESMDDYPDHGRVVRELASQGPGRPFYAASGIDRKEYPVLAFEAIDTRRVQFLSDPFTWTSKPKDWEELRKLNDAPVVTPKAREVFAQEVWLGEDKEVLFERPQPRLTSNPYVGAEVGLYRVAGETDGFFFDIERAKCIVTSMPCLGCPAAWTYDDIRFFVGDGSVASQQQAADLLRQGNADYNAWCAQHPGECSKTYPEKPIFGILGDPRGSALAYGQFSDPEMCAGTAGQCFDPGQSANLGGTPLEDLPIYWVPAQSVEEMQRLSQHVYQYQFPSGPVHYRPVLFLNDKRRLTGETLQDPQRALDAMKTALLAMGEPPYWTLKSSDFNSAATKRAALVAEVNNGASMLIGFDANAVTQPEWWAGGFYWSDYAPEPPWVDTWNTLMTRPQSLIALLFGCNMGNFQFVIPDAQFALRAAMFAFSSKTAIPFAVANGQSMDYHNYLWADVLASEIQSAPAGTPWPVIVFNAKNSAASQYPFMLRTLRTVVSFGSTLRKHAPTATDSPPDGASGTVETALRVRALGFGSPQSIEVTIQRDDHGSLLIYDVRGRLVTELWTGGLRQGTRTFTWNGAGQDGEHVRSGVYFARVVTSGSGTASTKLVMTR